MRLFIGFGIDNNTKDYAYTVQKQLTGLQHMKWVNPENMHITLVFIGDTHLKEAIIKILDKHKNHIRQIVLNSLYIDAVTAFPNIKNPKVIVMTLNKNKDFDVLQKNIMMDLKEIGLYIYNDREFIPHITLGRVSSNMFVNIPKINVETKNVQLSGIRLYSSQLLPKGPLYKIEYELK